MATTVLLAAEATAADQPLKNLVENYQKQPHTLIAPVTATATAAVNESGIVLKFILTNASAGALEIQPRDLPWGNPYSISWVAMTSDGHVLPLGYPIHDDFGIYPSVLLRPGEAISGTYELSWMLDSKNIPPDSDLVIIWTYDFPPYPVDVPVTEPNPICSGVAFVRTPKSARQP